MEFRVRELEREGDMLVVAIDGGVDARTAARFERELGALIGDGTRHLVIDCTNVTMITSQGIGSLLTIHRRIEPRDGKIHLAGAHGVSAQLLQLTHLDRIFGLFPDLDAARSAARRINFG